MDVHAALEEVRHWCAQQTAAGDPDRLEVECHATVWITIGESAPPWRVRRNARCSAGASAPVAQLRYNVERREWTLHQGGCEEQAWCSEEDASRGDEVGPLLDEISENHFGHFRGLPEGFRWPWA